MKLLINYRSVSIPVKIEFCSRWSIFAWYWERVDFSGLRSKLDWVGRYVVNYKNICQKNNMTFFRQHLGRGQILRSSAASDSTAHFFHSFFSKFLTRFYRDFTEFSSIPLLRPRSAQVYCKNLFLSVSDVWANQEPKNSSFDREVFIKTLLGSSQRPWIAYPVAFIISHIIVIYSCFMCVPAVFVPFLYHIWLPSFLSAVTYLVPAFLYNACNNCSCVGEYALS